MVKKFENFLNRYWNKINESKFVFSERFGEILDTIPNNNRIKSWLLYHRDKDIENIIMNYIDISENPEEISFTQDNRVKKILEEDSNRYEVIEREWLTHNNPSNRVIFDKYGFDFTKIVVPRIGQVGNVLGEEISRSGSPVCLFEWENSEGNKERIFLLKYCLRKLESNIWKKNRNPMRVGRFINNFMKSVNIDVTQKEIEEFVNLFKSGWDYANNAFKYFDLVKGYDIIKWYKGKNYDLGGTNTLGNSCMRYERCQDYFGIYTDNSDVCSMLILYKKEGGVIKDGKFTNNKIVGRAIVWKTNQGDIFMDRIYVNNNSDVELFKKYAENKGWWYKKEQNSKYNFEVQNGHETKNAKYSVELQWAKHDDYPYLDSLKFLKIDELDDKNSYGYISNDYDMFGANFELNDTEGLINRI